MNSTCICTVFKMKSWNFTVTSATLRDRSWKGWPFYRFPIGVRNKGLITQKTWIRRAFAQFSRWRVETSQEPSVTLRDRSWKGWPFYHSPRRVRNKGLNTQKTRIWRAFAQFSKCRVETPLLRQRLLETGRGEAVDSTVPRRGQE